MAEEKKKQARPKSQSNKPAKAEKPPKLVKVKKLFRGKTPQKKREQTALQEDRRQRALEAKEEIYSNERYADPEEALGPTVYNERYLKRAAVFRYLRYGIFLLLIVFLLGMLNLFKEEITVENFRYLLRNVNFELRTEMGESGSISFDSNPQNTFAVYRDSLALLSDRRIAIYDPSGRSSYTGTLNYQSPALASSQRYLMAYDRTGGAYSLYVGFSQVHQGQTGYPISDVDLSDEGICVIASRSKEYFGVVEVYNASFQLMNKIQKNKYIASVDLAEDGRRLLIASYYVGDTGICTELMVLAIDSDQPSLLMTVEDTLPYEAAWMTDGSFALICDGGVRFYTEGGKLTARYAMDGKNLLEYQVSTDAKSVALLYKEGSDSSLYRLCVLNEKGQSTVDRQFDRPVEQITYHDGAWLMLAGQTAYRIDRSGKRTEFTHDTPLRAMVARGDILYLCTATRVATPVWKSPKG